jgi:hypothetical protein
MRRVLMGLMVVGALGCGRTMTEDDCGKVAAHMKEVWDAEAKKAAPSEGPVAEKAAAVVRAEGERLVGDWTTECKKELAGRRIDPAELRCLLGADTVQEINKCAEL